MANTKDITEEVKVEKKSKKVKYIHPKDMSVVSGDESIICSVNGKIIKIQPGEEVEIDPKYAEVLKRSYEADIAAAKRAKKASGLKQIYV